MKKFFFRPILTTGLAPFAIFVMLGLASCGTGGQVGDGKKNNSMTGDLPGTGAGAQTEQEDSDQVYTKSETDTAQQVNSGEVIKVDSTEARGNSRWNENGEAGNTVQPSETSSSLNPGKNSQTAQAGGTGSAAGMRARQLLVGSNPANRSRNGQSMRADNPERKGEEIYVPK